MIVKNIFVFFILLLLSGCSIKVVNNTPSNDVSEIPNTLNLDKKIGLTQTKKAEIFAYAEDQPKPFNNFPVKMQERRIGYVEYPYSGYGNVDYIIDTELTADFRNYGFQNFLTWFPGPLIFAHSWRGNRFVYDLTAIANVLNVKTGSRKQYTVKSTHTVTHRSGNPFHFLGAAMVFPGIIKASLSTWPHKRYREAVYKVAYDDLWDRLSIQIANDIYKDIMHEKTTQNK